MLLLTPPRQSDASASASIVCAKRPQARASTIRCLMSIAPRCDLSRAFDAATRCCWPLEIRGGRLLTLTATLCNDASEILFLRRWAICLWPSILPEPRYLDHPSSCLTVVSGIAEFLRPRSGRAEACPNRGEHTPGSSFRGLSRLWVRRHDSSAREPLSWSRL